MSVKYIFVTGGVVSGLGKGITAASLGRLLKARGLRVTMQKFDPYLNVDPGTMNPLFTVTTTTPTAEVMTTKVGDQEVRIGKTDYILKSEYIEFSDGTITNVTWEN